MKKTVVITGASGGMGVELTRAMVKTGYHVIMACRDPEKANSIREMLIRETGNKNIDIMELEMSSLASVCRFVDKLVAKYNTIDLLMNNAGTIASRFEQTTEGFEKTVGVNYMATYLLTRKLIPYMNSGSRIVNMLSCTYRIGRLHFPDFFTYGRKGSFLRLLVYSNTKLALLLFTFELAERLKERGITVNAADPGIVSTDMIRMRQWFDPLTDIFFRPFIRKPEAGAATAIDLLLKEEYSDKTGCFCVNKKAKKLAESYRNHPQRKELWNKTEVYLTDFL